jgi:ABC-type transporter Mla maintaining outer membrane lipid asymmetry permease subunit MlaE
MQEQWGQDLEIVVKVLQISLAPAFLLAAIASLLNVYTTRLARIVDRSRELQKLLPDTVNEARTKTLSELRMVAKRKKLVRASLLLSILAAVVICLMVGLLFLMGLTSFSRAEIVIGMFAVAMALIAASLVGLLAETGLASHDIDVAIDDLAGSDNPAAASE